MEIHTLGVVGAGQMGAGIAQVAATNGVRVIMNDMNDEFVKKGRQRIVDNLNRLVEKRRFSETERRQTLDRISVSSDLRHMATADFVVEAASENEQIKFKLFQELDDICREHVILASNTSSIPIGRIAAATRRPDRVIGMHFMNPVPMMQLVEIIRGLATSDETYDTTRLLTEKLAKTPVLANDFPGSSPTGSCCR